MNKLMMALSIYCVSHTSVYAGEGMLSLNDSELSEINGAALMNLTYTSPGNAHASMKAENIGFYKLGLDAVMDLNANIKSIKLGCGGANGAGACDIDLDNVSLSGLSSDGLGRAASAAQLTNPFVEFAIKNPDNTATREIVGFRLSAEKVAGLLTIGTENSSTPNGINSLSGYMKVQSDSSSKINGLASTAATRYNLYGSSEYGNLAVTGRLKALGIAEVSFVTSAGGFNIPEILHNPFTTPSIMVNGSRQKETNLVTQVNVPDIILGDDSSKFSEYGTVNYDPITGNPTGINTQGGKVTATVTKCNWAACGIAGVGSQFKNVYMKGTIKGITADLTLEQSLGLIHNLPISSAMSLSLQKQAVKWAGTDEADVAQRGWWLSAKDPVNIGDVIPQDLIVIDQLFPQIASAVSQYLEKNPATTNDLGGLLGVGALTANIGTINLSNTPLKLNVKNLTLNGQGFAPNCYGSMKFC